MLEKKLNLPPDRIVVMPVVVSLVDYVKVHAKAETVADPPKVLDESDIDAVSQSDIDEGKKVPFFYINMNKTVKPVVRREGRPNVK